MNSRSVVLFLGAVGLVASTTACGLKPELEGGEAGTPSQEQRQQQSGKESQTVPQSTKGNAEGGEGGEGGES